jgi:hypothetical protein
VTSSLLLRICIEISFVDPSSDIRFIDISINMCYVVNYIVVRLIIFVVEHLKEENCMDNSSDISCIGNFIKVSCTGLALTSSLLTTVVRLSLC